MSIKTCPNCGERFNANLSTARRSARAGLDESVCNNCFRKHISDPGSVSTAGSNRATSYDGASIANRASANIAIQSARIVNAYGSFIQVLGIVVGVVIIIGGFILAHSANSALIAVIGGVVGLLDIAIFAVQGALFRMISNYFIARLDE